MLGEVLKGVPKVRKAYQAAKGGRSLFLMQGPNDCNRLGTCSYCVVPANDDRQNWSSFSAAKDMVSWADRQGFAVFNYKGGESLAECPPKGAIISSSLEACPGNGNRFFRTNIVRAEEARFITEPDGTTFFDYTTGLVGHASRRQMVTYITTNADFLKQPRFYQESEEFTMPNTLINLRKLKHAGLDIMALSLHSYSIAGLKSIVGIARAVAREGIIPVVSVVATADRADTIPQYARICAANGVLFSTAPVQQLGGRFSAEPEKVNAPTAEQMQAVSDGLLPLKRKGFIFNTEGYLKNLAASISRPWKCNPDKTPFVHVWALGEMGQLGVCQELPTSLDCNTDLKSQDWEEAKRAIVTNCGGCAYACNIESEGVSLRGEWGTLWNMSLIRTGHAGLVRSLGQRAVAGTEGVIRVPVCELEKAQKEFHDYNKLYKRTFRVGADLALRGAAGLIYGLLYVPIKLDERKELRRLSNLPPFDIKSVDPQDTNYEGKVCTKNCLSDFV